MAWNERFEYLPMVDRKPMKLPRGARVAVWVIVNVEEWDIQKSMARMILPPPSHVPIPPPDVAN